jgi:hypothetical protein
MPHAGCTAPVSVATRASARLRLAGWAVWAGMCAELVTGGCPVAVSPAAQATASEPAGTDAADSDDPVQALQQGGRAAVGPGQMPHVPKAITRPEGWPGVDREQIRRGGKPTDNHVLSSILPNPGGPLVPIRDVKPAAAAAAGAEAGGSGVVQAGFEDGLPSGTKLADPPVLVHSLDSARVVARVGPEVVLEGDLLTPSALAWLEKVSGGLTPEQVRELRTQICRQLIKPHVESLVVYIDACRTIPEDRLPEIEKKVNEAFDQQQLPRLVKEAGVTNAVEYDQLLRSRGQSLDRIRKTFFERALAQQWIQQKVIDDAEIPHADMIAWYQNHLTDYDFPAKARFEQLTVKFGAARTRGQAWNMLAAMGNDVQRGQPFVDVARARSEGPTAAGGGVYDWTTKGSLVSKVVDEAVFTLPVGQLSPILDDGSALHIIRVVERTDAGRVPFIEAQVAIRTKLHEERRQREMDTYLATIRERTPVWTIFDDDPGGGPVQTAVQPRTTR